MARPGRCPGMDVIDRADRTDRRDRSSRRTPADRTREPIYAQLVAEWRAQGRTVPAEREVHWVTLAGLALRIRPEPERS
ncbi:hypothetical protein [Streptomyces diastatochromogenes]|uniref:hypothetical protein n=1 Tax=Streptomyces diastatochromogenes TaxID=42236 RepID=UPI00368660E5